MLINFYLLVCNQGHVSDLACKPANIHWRKVFMNISYAMGRPWLSVRGENGLS